MNAASPNAVSAPNLWSRLQAGAIEQLHVRLESLIVLIVLTGIMAMLSPYFFSISNFMNILLATSTIGVLAIAATFVIGSGGLDLSLGSVMGLSGVVGAYVGVNFGMPMPIAVAGLYRRGRRRRFCQRHHRHPRLRAGLHRDPGHARHRPRAWRWSSPTGG